MDEEEIEGRHEAVGRILKGAMWVLIFGNLIVLNYIVFTQAQQSELLQTQAPATATLQNKVTPKPSATRTPLPTTTPKPPKQPLQQSIQPNVPREYFVPIGGGTSRASAAEWEDVPGLMVIIDTANYPAITSSHFEASVHVDGATEWVEVRLYNVTDKHPVWGSELHFDNAREPAFQSSGAITLASGNKAYKVQMRTQLQFTATLDQSRIKLLTR